jgi:hypothetical protein
MKPITTFFCFFLIFSLSAFASARDRGFQVEIIHERISLVIGNGQYQTAPLKNPVNDAEDIAKVLGERGFEVILKINVDKREMEEAIAEFGRKLRQGRVGLFYYAGHGMQVKGRNYLIPVDADIQSESDVRYEGVDAGRVLGKMEDAGNALNIVILDACRNNPFARSFRSSETGLADMDAPTGSLVAYATTPGKTAADGSGRNGVYTKYLIENIRKTGLSIEEILKRVRIAVILETNSAQVPWEKSSLVGNFYFTTGDIRVEARDSAVPDRQTAVDVEQEFWLSIKGSDRISDWQLYLDEYPAGRFVAIARLRIEQLQAEKMKGQMVFSMMPGTWETWQESGSKSSSRVGKDGARIWNYSLPGRENGEQGTTVCISVYRENGFSLHNSEMYLRLKSAKGTPVRLNLYSFVPGYSSEEDDDSEVPAGKLLLLQAGENEIRFTAEMLKIPDWWLEEHGSPAVSFNPANVRWLDFCAENEPEQALTGDVLEIHALDVIQKKQ